MSEADWRTVGYIGVTLGVFLLIGALITYFFPQYYNILGYSFAVYPYRDYSLVLFVAGLVFAVVGGGALWRADIEKQENWRAAKPAIPHLPQSAQSVPSKFCRFCGTGNKGDAVFCERCGRQIGEPKSSPQPIRRCANCGAELNQGDSWCRKCGTVVSSGH
jgi:ribosomal protein L40E